MTPRTLPGPIFGPGPPFLGSEAKKWPRNPFLDPPGGPKWGPTPPRTPPGVQKGGRGGSRGSKTPPDPPFQGGTKGFGRFCPEMGFLQSVKVAFQSRICQKRLLEQKLDPPKGGDPPSDPPGGSKRGGTPPPEGGTPPRTPPGGPKRGGTPPGGSKTPPDPPSEGFRAPKSRFFPKKPDFDSFS